MMYGEAALLKSTGSPFGLAIARFDIQGRLHDEAAALNAATTAADSGSGGHAVVQRRSRCSS